MSILISNTGSPSCGFLTAKNTVNHKMNSSVTYSLSLCCSEGMADPYSFCNGILKDGDKNKIPCVSLIDLPYWVRKSKKVDILDGNIWHAGVIRQITAAGVVVQGETPQPWDELIKRQCVESQLRQHCHQDEDGVSHNDHCGIDHTGKVAGLEMLSSRGCGRHFTKVTCLLCSNCTLIW